MYGFNNTEKNVGFFMLYFMGKIRAKVTLPPPIKSGPPTHMIRCCVKQSIRVV